MKHDNPAERNADLDGTEIDNEKEANTDPGKNDEINAGEEEIKVEIQEDSPENVDSVQERTDDITARLSELENALKEKEDKYLRLAAEFDNYKKRTSREFRLLIENANQELIRELLDILDNFRRALSVDKSSSDMESLHKGMELIYNQLDTLLRERGLEEIESVGRKFDPQLHEAVMITETGEFPEDHVAEELQKGYIFKGKVIRHSKVSVAKPKSEKQK